MFLEEEEIKEPKKVKNVGPEPKKVEVRPEPRKIESDIKVDEIISERDLFKSDSTFKFPVMFDEDELSNDKEEAQHVNVLDFETTKIKNKTDKDIKKYLDHHR